ncbi:HAMP domain-containing sensor histidine kinase [Nocardiopsis sp. RSe5-2]|uniref:Signal transduction histidine-protein kinase/phosphatase MprB n=1 Tax=Nocardiopsis endophytica TaxID=3018445 RepID=A0ABT4UC73_9ACTN|nr:HAMP domain-containing sensor histidine kinase [Nocardiopsis endophytica]MDA2814571.1 HAMP domain-containing sensor histidine kinase [Nocardiopsis endophytica]
MLRRLLALLVPIAFLITASLAVPLGAVTAQRQTQEMYVDRLNDAGRFASLGSTALRTGRLEGLRGEVERYEDLYGARVAVVDPSGRPVLASSPEAARAAQGQEEAHRALGGFRPEPPTAVWPWSTDDLVIAEPIGRDSGVEGAVLLSAPTERLRERILGSWALLGALSMVPLGVLSAVAWPLSRWVLRPVRRLDEATAAISEGDLSVRADRVGGPPELRRLAASFNAMVDAVERALHRQRAFVSDASHQLRNPLASLRLAVENLEPHVSGEDARQAHTDAVEEAKAMHRLLNSLTAATRMESFRASEPVELDEVLATRLTRWRALAEVEGMDLETRVPEGMRALAPPGGLGSVLDELMSNAIRLSGGSRIRLTASEGDAERTPADRRGADRRGDDRARAGGGRGAVVLHVADDGTGLDPEERRKALQRFWRGPRHQNVEGTGLGLAICADLVESAGGSLRLLPGLPRPDGGFGLDVEVRLPKA